MVGNLRDFILEEMNKRGLSARAFASFAKVSSGAINNQINQAVDPSIHLLRNLSRATGVPLQYLLALAFPDVTAELNLDIDPQILLLARDLSELSEAEFNLIKRLIRPSERP
jgi:transcriptional regulator with XRE-family HTH domain